MKEITSLEMHLALTILKSPEVEYNANSIARELKITPMGALKILKKLAVFTFAVFNNRRQNHNSFAFISQRCLFDDKPGNLLNRHFGNLPSADWTMRMTHSCKKQPEVIVNFSRCADCGTGIM